MPHTIETIKAFALAKNGQCLSTVLNGSRDRLSWKCHIAEHPAWIACLSNILYGKKTWCPKCAALAKGKNTMADNLARAHSVAKFHGGVCLETKNFAVRFAARFICKNKHEFKCILHNMLTDQKSWCKQCEGYTKLNIDSAHKIAEGNGGKCLSTTYVKNSDLLIWECKYKHSWTASLHNVKDRGSWCPTCKFPSESACFEIASVLFPKHQFTKTRALEWLRSPDSKYPLELDIWNPELRLAIEYNGKQHYEIVPRFHPDGEASLKDQQRRDQLKADLCCKHYIGVIIVPYTVYGALWNPADRKRKMAEFIWAEVSNMGYSNGVHLSTLAELLSALKL